MSSKYLLSFKSFIIPFQVQCRLETDLSTQKSLAESYKMETERLSAQVEELTTRLHASDEKLEKQKQQLNDVLRTAKLDANSDDALDQLGEQLRALQKQVSYSVVTDHRPT